MVVPAKFPAKGVILLRNRLVPILFAPFPEFLKLQSFSFTTGFAFKCPKAFMRLRPVVSESEKVECLAIVVISFRLCKAA